MVPSNPAAVQASFTALALPSGWSLRNSFTKLVLPGVAVAVLGSLGAAFSLAAVLGFPRRLPVSFTLVLLTKVGLIVPSNPAACHASFTVFGFAVGMALRNCLTKLVLPGVTVAVLGMLGADLSLAAVPGLPRQIASQSQLLPHLADDGVTDRPVEPGSLPSLVHGFGGALGIGVEEVLDEARFAWCSGGCCRHAVVSRMV